METQGRPIRYLHEADEAYAMRQAAIYYERKLPPISWADMVCDTTAGALRAMAQTIENGVSKTVAAVAIIVIAAAICAVSWMALMSYIGMTNLQTNVADLSRRMDQGFTDLNHRLDDRRGNNGGQSGP